MKTTEAEVRTILIAGADPDSTKVVYDAYELIQDLPDPDHKLNDLAAKASVKAAQKILEKLFLHYNETSDKWLKSIIKRYCGGNKNKELERLLNSMGKTTDDYNQLVLNFYHSWSCFFARSLLSGLPHRDPDFSAQKFLFDSKKAGKDLPYFGFSDLKDLREHVDWSWQINFACETILFFTGKSVPLLMLDRIRCDVRQLTENFLRYRKNVFGYTFSQIKEIFPLPDNIYEKKLWEMIVKGKEPCLKPENLPALLNLCSKEIRIQVSRMYSFISISDNEGYKTKKLLNK